jgi:hypothetical protein
MGHKKTFTFACLAGVLLVAPLLPAPAVAQTWAPAGSLSLARNGPEATLMTDGRVMVTGGNTSVGNGYNTKLAEVYDPGTNSWSTTGSTTNGRSAGHTATLLPDGRVLVTGGVNANVCTFDTTAEVYDPGTGTWSFTGSLAAARYYGTATRLANGKVLVNGGGNRCGSVFSASELYDPATGTWSPTGSMTAPREFLGSLRLADGRVLALGGAGSSFCAQSTAEVYNPATGLWTPTGSMATPRTHPTLALLADGRVMAIGGYSGCGTGIFANGPAAEIYDPVTGTWTPTGTLGVARSGGSLSVLGDGRALAVGGSNSSTTHSSAELWDPATGTWSGTAAMTGARTEHTATLLADGKVLVAAGYLAPNPLASAELFSFDDTAPIITITTPPDGASYTLGSTVLADYACADEAGGSGLASCVGTVADGAAIDTGTVGAKLFTVDAEDNAGNTASLTHDYTVAYDFDGFLAPIENPPVFNSVKAGAGVPVRFSLNGDQGLGILATGYPKSTKIGCDSLAPLDAVEETVTAGSSGLHYDAVADEYTYVWKTSKAWAGSCRQLDVQLADGVDHVANFLFR